jgi:ubiquinone/menaquinone biosynthesis C-methylase UbiE
MNRQPDFDRVARIYRWAEYLTLGPLLQRTRTHFLPQLTACRRALVLGDGDGRFLEQLLVQNDALQAVAVDTSAVMLRLLTQRCHRKKDSQARLRTWQGSALAITPAQDVDLVATHFFLDCLTQAEVDRLTQRIGAAVQPGTLWVVSDFGMPQTRWLRTFAALYVRGLYLAFRILTGLRVTRLPDAQQALAAAGFTRRLRHQVAGGLLYSELWERL